MPSAAKSKRSRPAVLLGLAAALCLPQAAARAEDSLATAVKATYLYKLAPFVQWPAAAASEFDICVVGVDPFGPLLDRAVAGQQVGGKPIVVRRLPAADKTSPCQIAFLGGARGQSVQQELLALQGAPVLSVTDGAAAKGVVDFSVVGGRVRFSIDDAAAAEDGLTISSKLLSLALSVKPRKPAGATP